MVTQDRKHKDFWNFSEALECLYSFYSKINAAGNIYGDKNPANSLYIDKLLDLYQINSMWKLRYIEIILCRSIFPLWKLYTPENLGYNSDNSPGLPHCPILVHGSSQSSAVLQLFVMQKKHYNIVMQMMLVLI